MDTTLLTAGIACVVASLVGGGLKAFGIEIPVISSRKREVLLFAAGCVLLFKPVYDLVRPSQSSLLISAVAQTHRGPVWDQDFSDKDEVVAKVTGEARLGAETAAASGLSASGGWRKASRPTGTSPGGATKAGIAWPRLTGPSRWRGTGITWLAGLNAPRTTAAKFQSC